MKTLRYSFVLLMLVCAGRFAAPASAQTRGRLMVTVADPTGGVLPNATVTLAGLEDVTKRVALAPVKTAGTGVATFENVAPGRYAVQAEFPGFDNGSIRDLRVRAGDNRQTITLALSHMQDTVTAKGDAVESASDRAMTFGTALTREQLDALSDDPDQMRQQLQDMAGPDAVISVDSFEGRSLPPKSQIRSIRISRDQFAAEIHTAGLPRIEVLTQPGVSPLRGGVGMNFHNGAIDGRNELVATKGPAQDRSISTYLNGTLVPQKLGVFVSIYGNDSYSTPPVATSGGALRNSSVRIPYGSMQGSAGFEYGLTRDQLLRFQIYRYGFSNSNLGLGTYDSPERAYSTENSQTFVYAQQAGPLGRRFFLNTRLQIGLSNNSSRSVLELPAYVITEECCSSGGAQRGGSTRSRSVSIGADLDYVRGIHSFRTGLQVDGTGYRSDAATNYLGTYVFENLAAFEAGTPRSYTRRIGDPNISYVNANTALYVQDDIRVRKNLTLTPGVRYEVQTHVPDRLNFGPRFGTTWAPFKSGRTTLRASWGIFYDWLSTGTYEQVLRNDGFRQQEINIATPTFPDPGVLPEATPINRYVFQSNFRMAGNSRVSTGVSQMLSRRLTVNATYAYVRGTNLLVGQNLNAPVDDVRPDPRFANVVQASSDGRSRQHTLTTTANLNFAVLGAPVPTGGKFIDWRRGLTVSGTFTLARSNNNTDGAFAIPATPTLDTEWGPAPGDVRGRSNMSINTGFMRNFSGRLAFNRSTAPPLTIRTGFDDNGDLVFNDRPDGVGRNSARTVGQWSSDAYVGYNISLGTRRVNSGGGISISGSSTSGYTVNMIGAEDVPRYRLSLGVNISNLTNHANLTGFSGVMTSRYFLQATNVSGVRRISFSANLSF